MLWTDESKFNRFGSDGKQYVRRPQNQELSPRYTLKTVKHGGGNVIVWASFSWCGVGPLYRTQGTMDQHMYKEILENVILPYAEENLPLVWKFQQNNDPKHTVKSVKMWFNAKKINVLEWPAQSPDLNPKKLFQQYAVDAYVKIKGQRLAFIRNNQNKLRSEQYDVLHKHVINLGNDHNVRPGRVVVLPSTYVGSPRALKENFEDAMAIIKRYGKPDLIITFTCNPKWREITENLYQVRQQIIALTWLSEY